jgi:hypothetical protein
MRRNPFALLSALGAFYAYFLLRYLGRGLAAAVMDVHLEQAVVYKILPRLDIFPRAAGVAPARLAILILMGPVVALLTGYLLMAILPRTGHMPWRLRFFVCLISYFCLVLDPIYYAVIPLLRLGGEPEALAGVLGIPPVLVALLAMAILGLNVLLVRKKVVPVMRR